MEVLSLSKCSVIVVDGKINNMKHFKLCEMIGKFHNTAWQPNKNIDKIISYKVWIRIFHIFTR